MSDDHYFDLECKFLRLSAELGVLLSITGDQERRLCSLEGEEFDEEKFTTEFYQSSRLLFSRLLEAIEEIDPARAAQIDRRLAHEIESGLAADQTTNDPGD